MKCVLCARRGRTTECTSHVCTPCAARLQVDVADILRLAADAAAYVMPGSSRGGGARTVPSSRPPLNVEAVSPELTCVPQPGQPPEAWPTVLDLLESWERLAREMRGMVPYGPASAARAAQGEATLTGVVRFLGAQVAWMTTEPEFPVDDFAAEVRDCLRVLRRWDLAAEERGTMVRCPTPTDTVDSQGLAIECGFRLYYSDVDEAVRCKRCGTTRSAMTLAAVAMADGAEVWLDPEAAASWLGVTEGTLRQWARQGKVQRSHGRYLVRERMGA